MQSNFLLFFFSLFCVIIQSNPIVNIYFPVKPDLTIPLIFYFCLFQKPLLGFFLTLWVGFLLDLFSGGVIGFFLFLRLSLFFLIYEAKKILFLENKLLWLFLVVLFFFWDYFLAYILFIFSGKTRVEIDAILILMQAAFTLFLFGLVFGGYYKLKSILFTYIKSKVNHPRGPGESI